MVDREKLGVDSRDEGKHTERRGTTLYVSICLALYRACVGSVFSIIGYSFVRAYPADGNYLFCVVEHFLNPTSAKFV